MSDNHNEIRQTKIQSCVINSQDLASNDERVCKTEDSDIISTFKETTTDLTVPVKQEFEWVNNLPTKTESSDCKVGLQMEPDDESVCWKNFESVDVHLKLEKDQDAIDDFQDNDTSRDPCSPLDDIIKEERETKPNGQFGLEQRSLMDVDAMLDHDNVPLCNDNTQNKVTLLNGEQVDSERKRKDKSKTASEKMFKCSECDYVCKRQYILKRHQTLKHDTATNMLCCNFCNYTTKLMPYMKGHLRRAHNKPHLFNYTECDRTKTRKELDGHISSSKHESSAPPLSSEQLEEGEVNNINLELATDNAIDLPEHKTNEGVSGEVFKCSQCTYVCTEQSGLEQHHGVRHPTYQCERCDFATDSRHKLNVHFTSRHDDSAELLCCALCQYQTRVRRYIDTHWRRMHAGEGEIRFRGSGGAGGDTDGADTGRSGEAKAMQGGGSQVLNCSQCDYITQETASLASHLMQDHHTPASSSEAVSRTRPDIHPAAAAPATAPVYVCAQCPFTTPRKNHLKVHFKYQHQAVRRPTTRKLHPCPLCDYVGVRKYKLDIHLKMSHHPEDGAGGGGGGVAAETIRCKHCPYTSRVAVYVEAHMRRRHAVEYLKEVVEGRLLRCPDCRYVTGGRRQYEGHRAEVHGEPGRLFRCTECDYANKRRFKLNVHYKVKHDKNAEVLKCDQCSYTTKAKSYLAFHVRYMHGSKVGAHRCGRCPFMAKTQTELAAHLRAQHDVLSETTASPPPPPPPPPLAARCDDVVKREVKEEMRVFVCEQCGSTEDTRADLNAHLRDRHDGDVEVHRCDHCQHVARSRRGLHTHFSYMHDAEAPVYACARCPFTTKRKGRLVAHHALRHTCDRLPQPLFPCPHCPHTSRRRYMLDRHVTMKHDTAAEMLRCQHCDYTTKVQRYMQVHRRLKHEGGSWPYECAQCDYRTQTKALYTGHLVKRHGQRGEVLRCPTCDYQTMVGRNLAQHVKRKHQNEGNVYRCSECEYTSTRKDKRDQHFACKHDTSTEVLRCPYCDYSTKVRWHLKRHCERRHGTGETGCGAPAPDVLVCKLEQQSADETSPSCVP